MNQSETILVTGHEGLRGTIQRSAWPTDRSTTQVLMRLENGTEVLVPVDALVLQSDGSYLLPITLTEIQRQISLAQQSSQDITQQSSQRLVREGNETIVVPIIAEELAVGKRQVETGRVRLTKLVSEREETVDEPLLREEVVVERQAVNRALDGPVAVRYEGDTMIVPVLEEMLVVEKRLVLKEEIRITKQQVERHEPQTVTLRTEEVVVERVQGFVDQKGVGTDIA